MDSPPSFACCSKLENVPPYCSKHNTPTILWEPFGGLSDTFGGSSAVFECTRQGNQTKHVGGNEVNVKRLKAKMKPLFLAVAIGAYLVTEVGSENLFLFLVSIESTKFRGKFMRELESKTNIRHINFLRCIIWDPFSVIFVFLMTRFY